MRFSEGCAGMSRSSDIEALPVPRPPPRERRKPLVRNK